MPFSIAQMSGADALNTKASMKEREAWQHVVGFLYTALFPCCPSAKGGSKEATTTKAPKTLRRVQIVVDPVSLFMAFSLPQL
jgi:hypothetical protein